MTHQLTLTYQDHITCQLYEASTNPRKVSNRKKSYFYYVIATVMFAFIFYRTGNNFLFYYSLFICFLIILFGQTLIKWYHKRHYTKHIKDVLKNADAETVDIEIREEQIWTADRTGNTNVNISEVEAVKEIAGHYMIKLTTGPILIIPKTNEILNNEVLEMIKMHSIHHIQQLDWKW